jgi:putative phosphoesterase
MKILVLSDSHGNISNMVRAVHAESPRMIFHLGDCLRDAERLSAQIPDIPLCKVPGNCDYCFTEPAEQILCLEDKRILLCHGHTYSVKQSLLPAAYAAEEKDLDVFLFGHTHRPFVDRRGKTWFMNPGSINDSFRPTYGIITLTPQQLDVRTVFLK